jgi:uncharacterized protein
MKRTMYNTLLLWKNSPKRKPLIIKGARQVGKTWLMKEFGNNEFENCVYINFESSERLKNMFVSDFNIQRIINVIEIETNQKINFANTLLIFDEIQEAEKGLTALKYFFENDPKLYIIAAGSLLGISLQKETSFPVGKVDILQMQPMSFFEFLDSIGKSQLLNFLIQKKWEIIVTFHDHLIEILRLYYFVGGMPEAVLSYIENNDLQEVRAIQEKIIIGYENDFAKHAPNELVPKIKLVWHSILSQLAKENRKFVYGLIKNGARAKEFEIAINWLTDAGLILKINRIEKPVLPLKAYADSNAFKLFLLDVGLLNAIGKIDKKILLEKNTILTEFKGAMTEQFVCQQLISKTELFYWTLRNGTAEIDFVIQKNEIIIPIEVKAEQNLKAKSLKVYFEKYDPKLSIRTTMNPYKNDVWLENIPLYGIEGIME